MLEVKDISVSYGNKKVINNVSFQLDRGKSLSLIGANGAGKTSLLSSLVSIVDWRGEIMIDDFYVNGDKITREQLLTLRSKIGYVFQNPDEQLFTASVFEDLAFGIRNNFGAEEVKSLVEETANMLNISHLLGNSPIKLSGGEKRRVAIGSVAIMKPDFIIFDEPTAFLDPRGKRELRELLKVMECGKIIATHDLDFAKKTCDRVLILKEGAVLAEGSSEDILYDIEEMEMVL